jgi:hypothetical protein
MTEAPRRVPGGSMLAVAAAGLVKRPRDLYRTFDAKETISNNIDRMKVALVKLSAFG